MTKNILLESQKTSLTSLTSCLAGHQGLEKKIPKMDLWSKAYTRRRNMLPLTRLIIVAVTAILGRYHPGYGKHFLWAMHYTENREDG